MKRLIPQPIAENQKDEESCRKFLAGNRSSFYQSFWNNQSPAKTEANAKEAKITPPDEVEGN